MEEENIFNELDMLDILVDGNLDVLDAFIQQYGINSINKDNRGILAICILEGRTDLALYLINETDIDLNLENPGNRKTNQVQKTTLGIAG